MQRQGVCLGGRAREGAKFRHYRSGMDGRRSRPSNSHPAYVRSIRVRLVLLANAEALLARYRRPRRAALGTRTRTCGRHSLPSNVTVRLNGAATAGPASFSSAQMLHPVDNCVAFMSDEELGARMSAESAAAARGPAALLAARTTHTQEPPF